MMEKDQGNPCPRCGGIRYIMFSVYAASYGDVQIVDAAGKLYDHTITGDVLDEETELPPDVTRYGIRNNSSASGIEVGIEICVGCGTAVGAPCYEEKKKS